MNEEPPMVRAKFENGAIVPLEPIPPEWRDGIELDVTTLDFEEISDKEWGALTADPTKESRENDRIARELIQEQRRISKEQLRRQLGP
jgi:hypothetical protein